MESTPYTTAWLARGDGSVVIGHGPFTKSSTPPNSGTAFYLQNFSLDRSHAWLIPHHSETLTQEEFRQRYPACEPLECDWDPLDAVPFSEVFQEILSAIHSGTIEKTVPVVTETGTTRHDIGRTMVSCMAQTHAPLRAYGLMTETSGFAGATPELLLSMADSQLETMALAGTARSEDRDVFAVDAKEIREHEYVAQTLVSKLHELGPVERRTREILDLGTLVHFLTQIRVKMNQPHSPEELIQRLHPTPALGPLPRTHATLQQLIQWRNQLAAPEQFGAPFGLWDHGRFDAVIAIRGVWWNDRQIQIPTGCGIIEASRLVNEWRELRLKREAVKQYLGLHELLSPKLRP